MAIKKKGSKGVLPMELLEASKLSNAELASYFDEGFLLPMAGGSTPDQNVYDVFQQAAITDLVMRELMTVLETVADFGDQIAPLVPTYDRTIKREIAEIASFGIGQFRAPDASPRIYIPKMTFAQEIINLLLLDEMTPVTEDLWLRMTSPTGSIRARAGVDLVTMGRILQLRNERLTEVMRWAMFKGNPLVINYDSGAATIQWPYLQSHLPSATVPWTDRTNSTPVDDLRAWQQIVANDIGVFASRIHMNSITFSYLQRSNQARGYLTQTDRNSFLPTAADIENLLWGGTGNPTGNQGVGATASPTIVVSDAGYRAETQGYNRGMNAMTKYLQNGEVLMTTEYVHEGERIADVADGMVALSSSFNELTWRQGPQTEIVIDHQSKTQFFRQASARFPRMRRPEAFLKGQAF
jgi:hypothetical protein